MSKQQRDQTTEQPGWAQDRMKRLDPRSDEFGRLLLKIAEDSDHPNDVAIAKILRRELRGELRDSDGT